MKCVLDENHEINAELLGHVLPCINVDDAERLDEKIFSNGDIYIGTFKGKFPHGKGKYTWADRAVYDGDWEEGKMTGKGQIFWQSGAKYDGDFSGGYMHGFGTFVAQDGSIYKGIWRMNIHHGLGRKEYCNSDIYDGSWREGVHEGSGEYLWHNGNTYIGNWKCGKMQGRGVMKWANGDLYDGFWFNGLRHGSGLYRYADGGNYHGTWTNGVKDGKGTFCPAASKHPSEKKWHASFDCDDSEKVLFAQGPSLNSRKFKVHKASHRQSVPKSLRSLDQISQRNTHSDLLDTAKENVHHDSSLTFSALDDSQSEVLDRETVFYEREYMQGICIQEIIRNGAELSSKIRQPSKFDTQETKKSSCVRISRGNNSNYLMLNLQLGISYSIGKITAQPGRDARAFDFGDRASITMFFPKKGSKFTPPHKSIDFYWKDYCPMVFRNLRELFKLDAAEYMMSICSDDGLRELSSPGKSGSIFYLSHDVKFFIKTLTRSELKFLLKMLPFYHRHVKLHENTLITKFFGLHRITSEGQRKVRFVVMGNMFRTELRIHRCYDLKGSTRGRYTGKEKFQDNGTLKDLDLSYEFHMDKLLRESLLSQLSLDTDFLEAQGIFDYSLLLGIHFIGPNQLNGLEKLSDSTHNHENSPDRLERECPKGLRLVDHEPSSIKIATGPHIRGRSIRARSVGDKEVDLLLPSSERLQVQLGVNMPARAHRVLGDADAVYSEENEELFEVYDVVLYMGVIDILQEFSMRRRVEHACKSMKSDPVTISIADPEQYAKRFISFLRQKVFPKQLPSSS